MKNRTRNDGYPTTDPILRDYIRLRDNDQCQICGRYYDVLKSRYNPRYYFAHIEIDHIVPYSFGGRNHDSNYALTCRECNRRKGNKIWIVNK